MPATSPPAPKRFALYLPKAAAEEIDNLISTVEVFVCRRFGGLTDYPAIGMYQTKGGEIQREEVIVLEGFGEMDTWQENGPILYSLAVTLAVVLTQETIGCSVDGRMFFVEPSAEDHVRGVGQNAASLVNYLEDHSSSSSESQCPW